MRSRLLLTTALCAVPVVAPKPAQAMPQVVPLIGLLATPSLGSLSIFGIAVGAGTVGGAVLRLGASFLLQAGVQRLARRRIRQQDIKRELADAQSRAVKRSVYGHYMATGTPVRPMERGDVLYCAYVLNSRPSAGNFTVHFDQREGKVVSGNMFDLSGPGATIEPVDPDQSFGSGADRPRVWICRGEQDGPPLEVLRALGGSVIEWDFDDVAFASVQRIDITIDGVVRSWDRLPIFGTFIAVGDSGGFTARSPSRSPFTIEISREDGGTAFTVDAATCERTVFGNTVTVTAISLGTPAGTDLRGSDIGRGLTLIWVRIPRGPNNTWFDRWPSWPPVVEVEGDYALVWDPRDPAQDPDDASTWQWSNNQALCLLDSILNNPIRKRPRWLVDIDAFAASADIADQSVARLYEGGTVPRYTANGVLVWRDAEIMDQVAPLAEAGGGDLIQVGGLISYVPPVSSAPVYQIRGFLKDGGFEFTRLRPGSEIPLAVRGSYVNPARGWSEADLPALAVGAGSTQIGDDGVRELPMPFVTEATQGMRLQKIARNRIAAQKGLRLTLPPDAINLVGNSIAQWDIPELPKCAGLWRVVSINPAAWMEDEGVAFRCPVELAEEPPNVDAWNPEVDEFELATEDYTPPAPVRVPPADLTATTGPGVAAGSVPRIRFSFEAVAGNVIGYEWQWREVGGEFAEGGSISENVRDALGRVFGFLVPVLPGVDYQIRVRTIYLGGVSDFSVVTITAQGPDFELDPPSDGQATGGAGQIEVSFLTPNNTAFEAIEFWGSDTDDAGAATLLGDPIASAANTVRTIIEDGLGDGVTRFYFARSRGPFGSVSAFSASVSATTDLEPEPEPEP